MLKNFINVALRNLWRQKGYTLINIFGLVLGVTTSIFILIYVVNELTYDRFHEKADRIYRVWISGSMPATEMRDAVTSPPMAEAMLQDYPEVEQAVRLRKSGGWLVRSGDRKFHETEREFIFADSTFFDVFSFKLLRGDPKTCLRDPRSIVLTEEYARKYFGEEDPMGKTLRIEQDTNLSVITGVMEDFPVNSHFHCKMIGSLSTLRDSRSTNWVNHNFYTYVVLKEGTDPEAFEARLYDMVVKYVGPLVVRIMGIDLDQFEAAGHSYGYRIQKLTDIHLHSNLREEMEPNGNPMYVYIFLVAAILILIVAIVNFMNLATARSSTRAREVGLRKVVGSNRSQLIIQFLTEAVSLSILAIIISIVLVYLLLPQYNNLLGMNLSFNVFSHFWIIPSLLIFAIILGILSGIYPAFVLASYRPISVLSSEKRIQSKKSVLRNLLIVFQFTVTIIILIGTFIVNRQLGYMQNKDTGFTKENVLVIHRSDALRGQIDAFKEEVKRDPNVIAVANSTHIPSYQYWGNAHWLEGWDRSEIFTLQTSYVSYDFDQALGLELVEGRFFDRNIPTDSFAVVINQVTVKALGIKDPLNTRFVEPGSENRDDFFMPIIGVVKDFHVESMVNEIKPMAIHFMRGNWEGVIIVRLGDGEISKTVDRINRIWEDFGVEHPFEYTWLSDEFDKLFHTERKTARILIVFSILSILVTCLGLLGLISYTTGQRIKEIGIRRTMGASVQIIVRLLSMETVRLLGFSALISLPAYFGVRAWLRNFAYHIRFEVGIYFLILLGITILVMLLSLLTVSFHSYKAATANPAESLRVE